MVIVDSSVWIDAFRGTVNGQTSWLSAALGVREVGLTSFILGEVLQGTLHDRQYRSAERSLLRLPVFEGLTTSMAIRSAQNFRFLRDRGVTVRKTIDCMIATFCIVDGHELLHRDRDFDAFELHLGLRVIHP